MLFIYPQLFLGTIVLSRVLPVSSTHSGPTSGNFKKMTCFKIFVWFFYLKIDIQTHSVLLTELKNLVYGRNGASRNIGEVAKISREAPASYTFWKFCTFEKKNHKIFIFQPNMFIFLPKLANMYAETKKNIKKSNRQTTTKKDLSNDFLGRGKISFKM